MSGELHPFGRQYSFIQFYRGGKYLGAGYLKNPTTTESRRNFAGGLGIRFYNKIIVDRRHVVDFRKIYKNIADCVKPHKRLDVYPIKFTL